MTNKEESKVLLAFASWEDRFVQGLLDDLSLVVCSHVVIFYFSNYSAKTETPRTKLKAECEKRRLSYKEVELDPDRPHDNLREVDDTIGRFASTSPIVVDISTMPREIIWYIFWLNEYREASLGYRYYSPADYSDEWISRDPGRPRLVHKLSGIARPRAKTALLVAVGFDVQRVWQLVRFFEPARLLVALQADSQFAANDEIMREYVDQLRVGGTASTFEIDAYGRDHGYHDFERQVASVVGDHNVVLSSLGPKLTAVSLYRIQRKWPEIGLVYAPANEFNIEYSRGIGTLYEGILQQRGPTEEPISDG